MPTTPELDLGVALLDCLRAALQANENPPAKFCLRVGDEVRQDLSLFEDECCDGLAYVKVNQVYPSANFPEPLEDPRSCAIDMWAVDLEMGVFRCSPVGDVATLASCEEWTASASQVHYDADAMRRAVACFRGTLVPGDEVVVRAWLPLGPGGGCTGGTQIVTAAFQQPC